VWRSKRSGKEIKIRESQNGYVFHEPHGAGWGTNRHEIHRFQHEYEYRSG
jgi:hypothetical protein